MGLEVGGEGTEKEKEEKKKEEIPLCESIGHRPLQGRCPAPTLSYNHDLPRQGTGTANHHFILNLKEKNCKEKKRERNFDHRYAKKKRVSKE